MRQEPGTVGFFEISLTTESETHRVQRLWILTNRSILKQGGSKEIYYWGWNVEKIRWRVVLAHIIDILGVAVGVHILLVGIQTVKEPIAHFLPLSLFILNHLVNYTVRSNLVLCIGSPIM